MFDQARARHGAGDIAGGLSLARDAIALDPTHAAALEHIATVLVTRNRAYREGLEYIERAVAAHPQDAGLWYARGWCYEFAAHEIARRSPQPDLQPRVLYERAAESFRRCLELHPEGKLVGDAEDLLDHVDNVLRNIP